MIEKDGGEIHLFNEPLTSEDVSYKARIGYVPENAELYCEWELGVVGSSKTEICLSVNYTDADYKIEIDRLKSLADNKIVYDVKNFKYPAYVTILGFKNTNYYALVDEQNKTIHYLRKFQSSPPLQTIIYKCCL